MLVALHSWWKPEGRKRGRRGRRFARPRLEWLENRIVFAGDTLANATPLRLTAADTAHVGGFLASAGGVDLYEIRLGAGDRITAAVSAQASGSGLQSLIRVFDANGSALALDDREGGDPSLSFQAKTPGNYFVGVSAAGDDAYDPAVSHSGHGGATAGLYALDVRLTPSAPPQSDLTGSSFRLTTGDTAAAGDRVGVRFTVEDRGAADPGTFRVEVVLSPDGLFGPSSTVLGTFARAELTADATGRKFSSGDVGVTLPSGLSPGPTAIGLRIVPDPAVSEAGATDKAGVHAGTDHEPLTLLAPAANGARDLSQVDPGLNTRSSGTLSAVGSDAYSFTVTAAQGSGRLTAVVSATGAPPPRLTLAGPGGAVLIQSDGGTIVQHLQPGTYSLVVSALGGGGTYRLGTSFVESGSPFARLTAGSQPFAVAAGDLNGDGIPDVAVANEFGNSVSVLLGVGDGTFGAHQDFAVGSLPFSVALADLNGDGKLDLVTADKSDNTVSVLLGDGDGTFRPRQTFGVGVRPGGVTVADLDGDGRPDLVVSNYGDGTVSVLMGEGDGTFLPQRVHAVGSSPTKASVVDVNGDGIPDLVVALYGEDRAAVLLGEGGGTFRDRRTFSTGKGPYALVVADVNGDGNPDLVTSNYGAASASVLLGKGDGTFGTHRDFPVGSLPYSLAAADVNGDGRIDLVTADLGSNDVSVLLGNGDGTFLPPRAVPSGKAPRGVAAADFNGDGRPDLIVANRGDNSVSLLLGRGDGSFQAPKTAAPGAAPVSVTVADLDRDGRADLVAANFGNNSVSVLLRNPDGTFQTRQTFATGTNPEAVAVADLNGDGIPDIVTVDYGSRSASVLLGKGDGTFAAHRDFTVGNSPQSVAVADVNGDGIPDLVVPDKNNNAVGVLLGNGDGTFQDMEEFAAAAGTRSAAVADVNGDGIPDLIAAGYMGVSVLLGKGHGTFGPAQDFGTAGGTFSVVVGDVNGDHRPDLITANFTSVSVLLGNGDGTFGPHQDFATGKGAVSVVVKDVNGDGEADLIASNYGDDTVSVLLGNGDGSFQPQRTLAVGPFPFGVAVGDVDGDGKPDIVTANYGDNSLSVLLNTGKIDGSFAPARTVVPGKNLYSLAVADINGDGRLDRITADCLQNTVTVSLGRGDGTFEQGQTLAVGKSPASVVAADLNGDGRLDLVVTNSDDDSVSVLLGDGDGSFQPARMLAAGRSPRAVAVDDVNGDGIPDLIVSDYDDGTASVLLGKGDGTFGPRRVFGVGHRPYSLAIADVNGDGKPDLIVADSADDDISVSFGDGRGSFAARRTFATGRQPISLAVADVNGDGKLDLVTADYGDGTASVLLNDGRGSFSARKVFAVGAGPSSVAVADVDGDLEPDLVVTDKADDTLGVLLGDGRGSFQQPKTFATAAEPVATAVSDVNGDGRPDLVTAGNHDSAAGVLLGTVGGSFRSASATGGVGLRNTPSLVDLDGDGVPDSVILDNAGRILFRKGVAGTPDQFGPPVILNDAGTIGEARPARDLTVLRVGTGWAIATADARFDPRLSPAGQFVYTVSLYTIGAGGSVTRATAFSSPYLPTHVAAADLDRDGRDDLVVTNSLDDRVTVAFQVAPGRFGAPASMSVGAAPSDLAFADVNGDGLRDIVVSDQAGGGVTALVNDRLHPFATAVTLRAGIGLSDVIRGDAGPMLGSPDLPVALATGDLTGDGLPDLVVVNQGAHSFTVLAGDGRGGFADPTAALTTPTSSGLAVPGRPGPVVVGDFFHDGRPDVAILMTGDSEIRVWHNRGDGTFDAPVVSYAGAGATGFSFVPGRGATPDRFHVGNGFGDVLTLVGDGTGLFEIDRSDLTVRPLAVGKTSDSRPFAVVADPQLDKVQVQFRDAAASAGFDGPQGVKSDAAPLLAPGAVVLGDLLNTHGATPPYLIVANRLGNQVLVYPGLPGGGFGPPAASYVGSEPVAVTVADLNGDGVPDLVAVNHGSNDLSVLLGGIDPRTGLWFGSPGPRLDSGGRGPLAADAADFNGDGIPDLRVTNSDGTVATLAGIGSGGRGTGFFKPPADLHSLGAAVSQVAFDPTTGREFFVSGGAVRSFDGTSFSALVSPGVVDTLGVVGGMIVAGFEDGTVGLMTEGGIMLAQSSSLGDRPGALQALQDGDAVDVYLTLDGSTAPAFVSLFISVATELPPSVAVAQATGLPNADLVLVATLLTGGIEEGTPQSASVALSEATSLVFLLPVKMSAAGAVPGREVEEVGVELVVRPAPGGPTAEELEPRVQEALSRLVLQQQVFDSVEDLVEAIKDILAPFRAAPEREAEREAEPPALFEGDIGNVALDGVAEAVAGEAALERAVVGFDPADARWVPDAPDGGPLWGLQSAVLVSWLCRPPVEKATGPRRPSASRRA